MSKTIYLYDTALRDGAQAEGISFSVADKLKIARRLDEFGIHFIEGGWPGSNPKDEEFFALAQKETWKNSALCAFSMTRRAGTLSKDDPNLQTIIAANTPVVTLVGKTWDFHVKEALRISLDENLRMVEESVAYVKSHGRRVFFDAEHFFDGYKANPEYALQVLNAAAAGGAEFLVLCDTNGGTMPNFIAEATREMLKIGPQIGIHTHNDCELAVANALSAVEAGATQVQGVINGFGERCGNCNLTSVIANLTLKLGYDSVPIEQVKGLSALSHFVAEVANMAPDDRQPFVGRSCFAHKGGMHVDAVQKAGGAAYEHIDPQSVGNERRILVSEYSGTSNVREVAGDLGVDLPKGSPEAAAILHEVKRLENQGYEFESAEASFHLLVQRALGKEQKLFDLLGARVINELRPGLEEWITEATLKIRAGERIFHTVAEGDGPIHALDKALRLALQTAYPALEGIRLTDFKVRVVNTAEGTAARVRVLIESADDHSSWSTVGVSTNVIEASWLALTEALEYGLTRTT
ncbi:2-isopropylmalate synthase [Abditibacterium utsteinense]|uniref:Citramalate synthase n=1 Tax=Abditibacterium utsteinense TaxID=1960156 RepID=A0A2S8STI7_9BACT|nr:citramalate synthase [Abditibacterium utsteinense]PQV64115.1 2-isopropylmalate synthase [Abditibacterium utsteinense]